MPAAVDISGKRFGRLVAKERVGSKFGKALWSFDCDCGTKGFLATQNAVSKGKAYGHGGTQSCGCWNRECLFFGPNPNRVKRPKFCVPITYPVPDLYPDKPEINEIIRRRYQFRWERVEAEARKIERGTFKIPQNTPFIPRDDFGNKIEKLDLKALSREKAARYRENPAPNLPLFQGNVYPNLRVHEPIDERELYGASSLADRIVTY